MELNTKLKRFSEEYVKTGNMAQSAITAGYSESYAYSQSYKLLENIGVKKYIEELMNDLKKETIADADEVMQYLTKVMRGEVDEPTLIGLGKGEQEVVYTSPKINDKTRAAELIGRRYAIFTDKLEIDGNIGVNIIDDLPVDDLDD